jgi:D-3-phosphoglycerate dehydrogenase
MSVARNVPYIDRTIRSGVTLTKAEAGAFGFQLTGKTLGLVGGGNIGFALGKMWSGAFGGKVLVFDPYLSAPAEEAWCSAVPTFRRVTDLDDLLPEIDVLSVHVPLLDSTQGLIGRDQLRRMKKSAVVINTARGGVIDEDALAEALEAGEITGAGLDAWSEEPPTMDKFSRLINNPRVVST